MYSLQSRLKEVNAILDNLKVGRYDDQLGTKTSLFQNKSGSCVNIHGSSEFLLQHSEDVNCDNNNKKHNSGIKHSLPHSFHSVMRRTKLTPKQTFLN